jgi:hypothetical protein
LVRLLIACLLTMVLFLIAVAGCLPRGSEFAARWQVEESIVEDNGITLRMRVSSAGQGILLVTYALYGQTGGAYLIPENVVITDDTGQLSSSGHVVPFGRFHDVNIGAITFEGPLYESSSLTFIVGRVRRMSQTLKEQETLLGEWKMEGFMVNILRGTKPAKGERNFNVFQSTELPISLGDVELTGIETVYDIGTTDRYVRWQLEDASGETRDLFYCVSRDGRVRPATLTEYLDAKAEQEAASEGE